MFHFGLDYAAGLEVTESQALKFFCAQTLGIMIEDAVKALWTRSSNTKRVRHQINGKSQATSDEEKTPTQTAMWIRLVGAVWVIGFMAWSQAAWIYPNISRPLRGPDDPERLFGSVALLLDNIQL